jgi:hypothetical protein
MAETKGRKQETKEPKVEPEVKGGLAEFKEMGAAAGFDMDRVFGELGKEFSKAIIPVIVQEVKAGIESDLTAKLEATKGELFEGLKGLVGDIEKQLRGQINTEFQGVVPKVITTLQEKAQEMGGGAPVAGHGGGLGSLLTPDVVKALIDKFLSPSQPEASIAGKLNEILRWHNVLSKIEKGGASGEEITKAISDAANPPK